MVAFIGAVLVVLLLSVGVFLLMGGRFRTRASARPVITEVPRTPEHRAAPEPPGPEALPPKHPSGLMRQVSDKDIEWEIRSGRVFNAIRLYREQTGADAQEARSAVEAWRNRLTAS
jgi:hypothetical protein